MRCRTISLDKISLVGHHGSLNAKQVEDAVNTALEAIEAEGNRVVTAHMLGEVTTIGTAMLMILFERNAIQPSVEFTVKRPPVDCTSQLRRP